MRGLFENGGPGTRFPEWLFMTNTGKMGENGIVNVTGF
jgi:hypothetical protein